MRSPTTLKTAHITMYNTIHIAHIVAYKVRTAVSLSRFGQINVAAVH